MSSRRQQARYRWLPLLGACALAGSAFGCSVGQGTGFVRGDVVAAGCWNGPIDLKPDFFAATPFADTLTIRVQRGEQEISVSDGFTLLVNDVPGIRFSQLGIDLPIGLPVGVSPVGFPLPEVPDPPAASMSLFLNSSCRGANAQLTAFDGSVNFTQLFSGNPNEEDSQDRVTNGTLRAYLVDPNDAVPRAPDAEGPAYEYPPDKVSVIDAAFNFVFHRGIPAQPFP
jgi:hypothetical protein